MTSSVVPIEKLPENFEACLENHYLEWQLFGQSESTFIDYLCHKVYPHVSQKLLVLGLEYYEEKRSKLSRAGVCCYQLNPGGQVKVALVKNRLGETWGPPKGVERESDDGKAFLTAFREWKEETGFDLVKYVKPKTHVPRIRTNKTTMFFMDWPVLLDESKIESFSSLEIERVAWFPVFGIYSNGNGQYILITSESTKIFISLIAFQCIQHIGRQLGKSWDSSGSDMMYDAHPIHKTRTHSSRTVVRFRTEDRSSSSETTSPPLETPIAKAEGAEALALADVVAPAIGRTPMFLTIRTNELTASTGRRSAGGSPKVNLNWW